MNLFKEYLADVTGVDIFAIVSMVIFILVFVLMVIHAFSIPKAEVKAFKNLPLEGNEDEQDDQNS